MGTNFYIALRFLLFKKRSMLMTLSGIVFGVAFFILTQAQTSGFEKFFIEIILGSDGAIRVEDRFQETVASRTIAAESNNPEDAIKIETQRRRIEGIDYPATLKQGILAMSEVTGAAEVVRGNITIEGKKKRMDAHTLGIRLDEFLAVSMLRSQTTPEALETFQKNPQGILLGIELASRSGAEPGDTIMVTGKGDPQRFTVSGVFETGSNDIDKSRAITHINAGRSLLQRSFGASYIQVSVEHPDNAVEFSEQMKDILRHDAKPWQRREVTWLNVFSALRFSSAITVSTIIIVSALGMFNTLAMLVIEKTKEIAILRSFGFSKADVTAIFLWLSTVVIVTGVSLGCLAGALLTLGVSKIPLRIRGVFSTDHFIVNWDVNHYIAAAVTASIVVFIAGYFPARRAARIEPGDIIRGTSS